MHLIKTNGLFYPNKTEKVRPNKTFKEDQLKSELE